MKVGARTIRQLETLLNRLVHPELVVAIGDNRPVYNRMNLAVAVADAAKAFHQRWRGLLGLEINAAAPKEHWTRIKAMSRRLAEGWQQEGYSDLLPIADLSTQLQEQVYRMLQSPERWTAGAAPSEEEQEAVLDKLATAVTQKLIDVSRRQLRDEGQLAWQRAYLQRGIGSTFDRARIISSEVYDRGAPVPSGVASPDQNKFLNAVADAVAEVAEDLGADLD